MKRSLLSFFTFTFFSATIWGAQLYVPDTISVLKIDNKPQSLSFFSRETTLELSEGEHILLLQYKELFENYDEDDHVTIKSEPFVLLFKVKGQQSYTLSHAPLTQASDAREFAESPIVVISDQNKAEVEIYTQNLVDFEARAIFNSMDNQVAAIKASVASSTESQPRTTKKLLSGKSNPKPENTQAYDMLKYWWKQASKAQQAKFLNELELK